MLELIIKMIGTNTSLNTSFSSSASSTFSKKGSKQELYTTVGSLKFWLYRILRQIFIINRTHRQAYQSNKKIVWNIYLVSNLNSPIPMYLLMFI